jgi:hypothetical protein
VCQVEVNATRVLITEYERLKDEQRGRIGFRDNLIYATLASIAAVVAATLGATDRADLLLLMPPVCVLLGWTYLVNDEKVSAIGRYIRLQLAPRLADVVADPPSDGFFQWETQHRTDRHRLLRKASQLVADIGLFCLAPVGALTIFWLNGPHTAPFLTVSVMEILFVAALGAQIVWYADLRNGP